jgi:hypothetical protein
LLDDRALGTDAHLFPREEVLARRRKVRLPSGVEPFAAFVPEGAGGILERRAVRERGPLRRVDDEAVPCCELAKPADETG